MSRSWKLTLVWLGLVVGVFSFDIGNAVHAEEIVFSQDFSSFGTLTLPQFDDQGGTRQLTGVQLEYSINPLVISVFGENLSSSPLSGTVSVGGQITFDGPATNDVTFPVNRTVPYAVGPNDGVPNSGPDFFTADLSFQFATTLTPNINPFIGTGTFPLIVSGGGPVVFSPNLTRPNNFPSTVNGNVTVRYTFESLVAVPEPTSMVALGFGTIMLGVWHWRRKIRRPLKEC